MNCVIMVQYISTCIAVYSFGVCLNTRGGKMVWKFNQTGTNHCPKCENGRLNKSGFCSDCGHRNKTIYSSDEVLHKCRDCNSTLSKGSELKVTDGDGSYYLCVDCAKIQKIYTAYEVSSNAI